MPLTRRLFLHQATLATAALPLPRHFFNENIPAGDGQPFTVLFQGDSITDGNRGRTDDPNHIMGHGYAFSIASRLGADYPERSLRFINKAISGNTITDLATRWEAETLALKPDVVSILVGVNDVLFSLRNQQDPEGSGFGEHYSTLLTATQRALPNAVFVLGEPFILPVGPVKENLSAWQPAVAKRQTVVRNLAKRFNAVFVGYQQVFQDACKKAPADYWIWDGIHPTVPGHELMAREWLRQVGKRVPQLR
jgi:lysophospholipase L1-like esterase